MFSREGTHILSIDRPDIKRTDGKFAAVEFHAEARSKPSSMTVVCPTPRSPRLRVNPVWRDWFEKVRLSKSRARSRGTYLREVIPASPEAGYHCLVARFGRSGIESVNTDNTPTTPVSSAPAFALSNPGP